MKLGNQAVNVTTRSRNLIPFPYYTNTANANIIKNSYDGKITVNGTSTTNAKLLYDITSGLEARKTYTLSGCPSGGDYGATYCLYVAIIGADGKNQFKYDEGSGVTFTLPEYQMVRVFLYLKSGYEAKCLVFKPMLNEGSTALPYEPYIQHHDMRVMQNLIDVDKMVNSVLTKNEDGSYTITKNGSNRFSKIYNCDLSAGKYIFLADVLETTISRKYKICINIRYKDGKAFYPNFYPGSEDKNVAFQLIKGVESIQFYQQPTELDGAYTKFKNLRLYRLA